MSKSNQDESSAKSIIDERAEVQRMSLADLVSKSRQGRGAINGDEAVAAGLVNANVVGEAGFLNVDLQMAEFASRLGDGKAVGLAGVVQEANPESAPAVVRIVIAFDDGKYLVVIGKRVHALDKAGLQAVLPYVLKYMAKADSVGGA